MTIESVRFISSEYKLVKNSIPELISKNFNKHKILILYYPSEPIKYHWFGRIRNISKIRASFKSIGKCEILICDNESIQKFKLRLRRGEDRIVIRAYQYLEKPKTYKPYWVEKIICVYYQDLIGYDIVDLEPSTTLKGL